MSMGVFDRQTVKARQMQELGLGSRLLRPVEVKDSGVMSDETWQPGTNQHIRVRYVSVVHARYLASKLRVQR